MPAPIVKRLLDSINSTIDPIERACLTVDLACYLAKAGDFGEANIIKTKIRSQYGKGENLKVSVRLMCLDALLFYYHDTDSRARDRMARAALISRAAGDLKLVALTSSWLAHFYFNQKNIDDMRINIDLCFSSLNEDDGTAQCRISIVLGDAFLYVGNVAESRIWYERARNLAVHLGDQTVFGAIAYNRAALSAFNLRFNELTLSVDPTNVDRVDAEIESSINFQELVGHSSLGFLMSAMRAGILIVKEQYLDAQIFVDQILDNDEFVVPSNHLRLIKSDKILILAKTNQIKDATLRISQLGEDFDLSSDSDDNAIVLDNLAVACDLCGLTGAAERWRVLRDGAVRRHQDFLSRMRVVLSEFDSREIAF